MRPSSSRKGVLLAVGVLAVVAAAVAVAVALPNQPALTIVTPAPGSVVTAQNPTLRVDVSDPVAISSSASLLIDNGGYGVPVTFSDGTQTEGSVSYGPLPDGNHTAKLTVKDTAGNSNSVSWSFSVQTPPGVTRTQPVNGAIVTVGQPALTAWLTDNGYVAAASISVDGVRIPSTWKSSTRTVSATPPSPLADGEHIATVNATDGAGFASATSWRFSTVTAGSTRFSDQQPASGGSVAVSTPTVSVACSDVALITGATMLLDGVTVPRTLQLSSDLHTATVSFKPAALADGAHTVKVTATNNMGYSSASTWTFTVAEPPKLSAPSPAVGGWATTTGPVVSATAVDNGTITSAAISIDGTPVATTYDAGSKRISAAAPTFDNDSDHSVVARVTDAAGGSATLAWTFHVQIYPEMPVAEGATCESCHVDYLTTHPMTDCDACHGGGTPVQDCRACHPFTWDHTPALFASDAWNGPYACTRCHQPANAPKVPLHPEGNAFHTTSGDMTTCRPCHVSSLTVEHYRRDDANGDALTCATCHYSTDEKVKTAIAAGNTSCTGCHSDLSAGHLGKHDTSVGPLPLANAGGATCGDCHDTNMMLEHGKKSSSSNAAGCASCHPDPRSTIVVFDPATCSQAGCHAAGGTAAMHGAAVAKHAVPTPAPTCAATGCHTQTDVTVIHSKATTTTAEGMRSGCLVCHTASKVPTSTACMSCHVGDANDFHADAGPVHTVKSTTSLGCVECHDSTDVRALHSARTEGACAVCHANPTKGDLTAGLSPISCEGCHADKVTGHADPVKHTSTETCVGTCHTTHLETAAHVSSCLACHKSTSAAVRAAIATGDTRCGACHTACANDYVDATGQAFVLLGAQHDGNPPVVSNIATDVSVPTAPVVKWTTDESATTYVDYGTTTSYGSTVGNATLTRTHAVNFPATVGTLYHFRIRTADALGNQWTSGDYTYRPTQVSLTRAVKLSGGKFSGNPASISWGTAGYADSWVDYGATTGYGTTAGSASLVTSHTVTLPILANGLVHYRVRSSDGFDTYSSADMTFTSNSTLAQSAPALYPPVANNTASTLTFTWSQPNDVYTPFSYRIHIWKVSGASTSTYDKSFTATSTTLVLGPLPESRNAGGLLAASTTYDWTVVATDKDGDVYPTSSTGSFTYANPASCPILYSWNGSGFGFITDVMGRGVLGIQVAPGVYRYPPAVEDSRIDGSQLVAADGSYKLMLKNEKDEIEYIDNVQLEAVDHPAGTKVYLDDLTRTFDTRGLGAATIYTVRELKPVVATYSNIPIYSKTETITDEDISAQLSAEDGSYGPASLFDDNRYTFDLGDLSSAPAIKLVMNGWSDFASTAERAAWLDAGAPSAEMKLEVQDASGGWVTVDEDLSFIPGLTKTAVLDLTGKFPAGVTDYKVRMRGLTRTYFDHVAVDTSPQEEVHVTKLDATSADLSYKGVAAFVRTPTPHYDYDTPDGGAQITHEGAFTKFGDVLPLVTGSDDKFVIMDSGDQLALRFAETPVPAGMERTYVIHTDGYFQEVTGKVDPLPFHGMSNYPYGADEHYPDDADHTQYLQEWNTRIHTGLVSDAGTANPLAALVSSVTDAWNGLWSKGAELVASLFTPAERATLVAEAPVKNLHYSINTDRLSLDLGGPTGAVTQVAAVAGWESQTASGTMPTIASPGSAVPSATVAKTASQDGQFWITSLTSSDRAFNWQVAKFQIDPAVKPTLTSIGASWYGHGDPTGGYPTVVYVWNFRTGRWDLINSMQSVLNAEGAAAFGQPTSLRQSECLRCHGTTTPPAGVTMPSALVKIGANWVVGNYEYHGGGGTSAPIDCNACHTSHQGGGPWYMAPSINGTSVATITTSNQMQAACKACHTATVYDDHGGCNGCHRDPEYLGWHDPNGIVTIDTTADCLACHGHGKTWTHPPACHCGPSGAVYKTF